MAYDEFTAKMVRECERLEQENAQLKADCDTWTKKYVELDQVRDLLKAELIGSEQQITQLINQCAQTQNERDYYKAELAQCRQDKDGAYLERNRVVAALTKCFSSGVARTSIDGWSDDWNGCVYIDLPTGQVSWHYHDSHAELFAGLPAYTKPWDGHDTDEKYRRVAALTKEQCQQRAARLMDALIHIAEYWNGAYTDKAMSNALDHIVYAANRALEEDKA